MQYYIAIQKEERVHLAITPHPSVEIVKIDLTWEQLEKIFKTLMHLPADLRFFTTATAANQYANTHHFSDHHKHAFTLFHHHPPHAEVDRDLIIAYGQDKVFSEIRMITLLFQVNINDDSILQKDKNGHLFMSEEHINQVQLESVSSCGLTFDATSHFIHHGRHLAHKSAVRTVHAEDETKSSCVIV